MEGRPIFGRYGDDRIDGGERADSVRGLTGRDVLRGNGGDDDLFGGSGDDDLSGGGGSDQLEGGSGRDVLKVGAGIDGLSDGRGYDLMFGEDGGDRLSGGGGVDVMTGGAGDDRFTVNFVGSGRILVGDFIREEVRLEFVSYSDRDRVPADFIGLDSNDDGVLNADDRGFMVSDVSLGADIAASLVFDATSYAGSSAPHLTLFGVSELPAADLW